MRLILVRPNWVHRWLIGPPIGLGYIVAAMKKAGHECIIYDAWLNNDTPMQAANGMPTYEFIMHPYWAIKQTPIDIVGIQMFSESVNWTKEFIALMRGICPTTKFIVGGPYVTAVGDKARIEVGADVGISGECDTDFIKHLNSKQWIKMPYIDVNEIAIPDWDSMNLPAYWPYMNPASTPTRGKRIGIIQRTRGCNYHCTFCAAGAIMGHKVRFRDDDNVIEEIEYLKQRWDVNEIWFQDDNVIANYKRGIQLFERLEPLGIHIRLPYGIRWENVDVGMVQAMKRAGVYCTGIGIESGNPRVLARIKKNINQDKLKEAIRILAEYDINTIGFFIFGLPTETREEMKDTVKFALSTKLHHGQFGTFIPYPGSEDYNAGQRPKIVEQNELIKIQRNATLRFYLRPRIIWHYIAHFRWSQLKALWGHPWVKRWRGK